MNSRHLRSAALWTLDPLPSADDTSAPRADTVVKILPNKGQNASAPPETSGHRGSVVGQLLAEIW